MGRFYADVNYSFTGKIKNQSDFFAFNNTFQPASFSSIDEFIAAIRNGHAFTAVHHNYLQGDSKVKRHRNNWKEAWVFALDFDSEDEHSTMDYVADTLLFKEYGAFIYTTPSHTQESPRCRAVFVLDAPFTDPDQYALAATWLTNEYQHSDNACKDPSRLFYGSPMCDVLRHGKTLPLDVAMSWSRQEALNQSRRVVIPTASSKDIRDAYTEKAVAEELRILRGTQAGNRHNALLRASVIIGGLVLAEWSYIGTDEAIQLLYEAAIDIGLVEDDGKANVVQTINDGFRYADPRPKPDDAVYEAIEPIRDLSLGNLLAAYRAGYEDGSRDTAMELVKKFGLPPFVIDWYNAAVDGSGALVVPYYDKGWSLNDIAHMTGDGSVIYDDGTYPVAYADPDNDKQDLLIITDDISAAFTGWGEGAPGWSSTSPDFVAATRFHDVHAAPDPFFSYGEIVVIGGEGSSLTKEDSYKLPNCGFVALQDDLPTLFNKYKLSAGTFKRIMEQAW